MGNTWSWTSGRTRKSSKYRKSDISSPLKNGPPFPPSLLFEAEHFPSLLEKLQGPQTRGSEKKWLSLVEGNTEVEEHHNKGRSLDPPERSQTPPWKFWRKLSTRRTEKKPRVTHKANGTSSKLGLHPEWDLQSGQDPDADGDRLGPPPQASLPDVVDKAVLRRSSSLKAPPKPPRLFLFRSSSINNPRSSVDGGSQRNSLVVEGGGGGQEYGADVVGDPEPIYVNSAFSAALKTGLSTNDRIIPPTVNNSNNNSIHKDVTATEVERINGEEYSDTFNMFSSSRKGGTLSHSTRPNVATVAPTYSTLPHTLHKSQRQKALSPELTLKRTGRSRRRSGERPDLCRQRHIMHSVVDLLCQRFDPFPLLDDLLVAGVIGEMDVQAFRGHPDRKLICESLANVIGEGESTKLAGFIDVIRAGGQHEEIVRVLDAMRALDRLIHDLPCRSGDGCGDGDDDAQILADEKMISYEVGYLAPDGITLRPVVELERVRLADRRLSKRVSRLSASCSAMTETDLGDNIMTVPSGPVMMNASVTGHNLSGLRAQALAEVIRQHDCLLELRIGKTQLCSADVAVICEALPDNSSLVSLDIRLNALDHAGAAAVAEMLCRTQSLRQLNLSSTGLDMAGSGVIITALSSCRTLEDLDMSFLDVGDASCEHIRDMLKANSCLQKLRLRSNNFSPAGCFAIAEGLSRNRTLLELDLSRNYIGDTGVEALARYVPESSLTDLSLENCGITTSGCDSVAQIISGSKKLRHLDLSVNFLGDTGVFRLAVALERSSVLHTVGLNMCGVTNDGFSKILDVLEKNASITLLKLCYNRLGREYQNPAATCDNLRYRLRIVTSSKPKLKILLWGNAFDEA